MCVDRSPSVALCDENDWLMFRDKFDGRLELVSTTYALSAVTDSSSNIRRTFMIANFGDGRRNSLMCLWTRKRSKED